MIGIIDYGVGNLFSLVSSMRAVGSEACVISDPDRLKMADRLVLPGVGAFGDAAQKLRSTGMADALTEQAHIGKPVLGICLGMQLLFDRSFEYGEHKGLGLLHGEVRPLTEIVDSRHKIPHIGWNALELKKPSALFRYIHNGDMVYFVHSYYGADCADDTLAVTEYSAVVTAAVGRGNIAGCQFHPEKSGAVGLKILRAFAETEDILC